MSVAATPIKSAAKGTRADAKAFDWEDPFFLDDQLTEERLRRGAGAPARQERERSEAAEPEQACARPAPGPLYRRHVSTPGTRCKAYLTQIGNLRYGARR